MKRACPALVLLLVASCVDGVDIAPLFDAGTTPPTTLDAGNVDGGRNIADSGEIPLDRDAGEVADAGDVADAGEVVDAGEPVDAGPQGLPWTLGPTSPDPSWVATPPECSGSDWLSKYLRYRQRLRGTGTGDQPGFVSIGAGPGQSLVAGTRMKEFKCADHWLIASCRRSPPANADGFLQWGDSTIWLGWYMATLATEYAAFKQLGLPTTETESDLAYALAAFNRLDESAETVFGLPPARDGFFRRDDVFPDFIWADAAHTQLRFPRNDGLAGYGCVASGGSCGTVTTHDGYFMSQDQVIEMLPGLALIAKLVPSGVVANGIELGQEAKVIVDRQMRYLRSHDWKIVDPVGESPPNQWGGTALPYSYVIAKAANHVVQGSLGTADYQNFASNTAGLAVWTAADLSWPAQTLNNQAMILSLAVTADEWSVSKLVTRSASWMAPTYAMTNGVLYDRPGLPPGISAGEIEGMLTTAPCGGPCHKIGGCEEVPGWMGEHRWKSPEDRNGDVYGYTGEYTGLDYMLLHNLYVLARAGRYQLEWEPPPRCRGTTPLTRWQAEGPTNGEVFDPWEQCNRRDFGTQFCGRSFAGWLDAAYRGEARIFVGTSELRCDGLTPCTMVAAGHNGSSGDDLFVGTSAGDVFDAGAGNDCLVGGEGNDQLRGEAGQDELHGGPGNDTLCGERCNVSDLSGQPDAIYGDDGDDDLQGGPGIDGLYGGAGNDRIRGDMDEDTIFGGEGNDDLDGEMGDDQIFGNEGDDLMRGGMGTDMMQGGLGRDRLDGAAGNDMLNGGPGDDFLMGGDGEDTLWGEEGSDRLCGGCDEDRLNGGWEVGTDSCRGEAAGFFGCLTNTSNTEEQCESHAGESDCRDAAFDSW